MDQQKGDNIPFEILIMKEANVRLLLQIFLAYLTILIFLIHNEKFFHVQISRMTFYSCQEIRNDIHTGILIIKIYFQMKFSRSNAMHFSSENN